MRALFLSCSRSKRGGDRPLPAREMYDGPAFRVLRACGGAADVSVWVLSAEHGLITADKEITAYDRIMTRRRAEELRAPTAEKFAEIPKGGIREWMVCMGQNYARAMADCAFPAAKKEAKGTIGRQISVLKQWLENLPDEPPRAATAPKSAEKQAIHFGGRRLYVSARDIMDIAATAKNRGDAANFQTWYVQTLHGKAAVKWLVSELSGLPVSRFRTADALRVLDILKIPYNRES